MKYGASAVYLTGRGLRRVLGSGKGLGRILRGWRWLRTGTGKLEGIEILCWEVRRGWGRGIRAEKRLETVLGGLKGLKMGAGRREVGDGCCEVRSWGWVL